MRTLTWAVVAATVIFLNGGCQILGSEGIKQGRGRFNSAIHKTNEEELLINILRISQNRMPLFLEITDITSLMSAGANGSASATLPESASKTYSLQGQLSYSETPTVRYRPIQGDALVKQIYSPISTEHIGLLAMSDWAIDDLFYLTVLRFDVEGPDAPQEESPASIDQSKPDDNPNVTNRDSGKRSVTAQSMQTRSHPIDSTSDPAADFYQKLSNALPEKSPAKRTIIAIRALRQLQLERKLRIRVRRIALESKATNVEKHEIRVTKDAQGNKTGSTEITSQEPGPRSGGGTVDQIVIDIHCQEDEACKTFIESVNGASINSNSKSKPIRIVLQAGTEGFGQADGDEGFRLFRIRYIPASPIESMRYVAQSLPNDVHNSLNSKFKKLNNQNSDSAISVTKTPSLLKVSTRQTQSPHIAVNYEGKNYYLGRDKTHSINVFSLLSTLMAMQAGDIKNPDLILTLPIN